MRGKRPRSIWVQEHEYNKLQFKNDVRKDRH